MIRDAELNQLVQACAAAIRGVRQGSLDPDLNWPRLIRLARRHRVQGLAWLGLIGGTESDFPPAKELFEDTQAIARQNLIAVSAASRLLDECTKRGLRLIFLKGLTLGSLAYPLAMVKMSTDVDVLVDPAQIVGVEQCLQELGYEAEGIPRSHTRRSAMAKEWTWIGANGVVIDLHVRLADSPKLLPEVSARAEPQMVEVAPSINLPTLPRTQLFAYLCVHGTSSAWFRLKWAADLAAFIFQGDDDPRQLYAASQSLGSGRCPDVSLLVVDELFGPLVPEDLLQSVRRDPVTRSIARLSLRELANDREPLERPFGTVLIHLGQFFIERGPMFPVREFGRQLSNLVG